MFYCTTCEPDHPGGYGWSPALCGQHGQLTNKIIPEAGYITVADTAKELGVSETRVRWLCAQGRIVGVVKLGRDWQIPTPVERIYGRNGRPPKSRP